MDKQIPTAIAGGPGKPLVIGNVRLPCYVLDDQDNTRVLSLGGMKSSIGMSKSGGAQNLVLFVQFLERKGIEINDLAVRVSSPILFHTKAGGKPAHGRHATILPDLCEAILLARDSGILTKKQRRYADYADLLIRSFAKVGIIALVDEATGYEKIRKENALANILERYLADDMRKWSKTFPYEFYAGIARLRGWNWFDGDSSGRPRVLGHYTNDIIYGRLAPGILDELRKRNPRIGGRRRSRHHQWFNTASGHPKLKEHIAMVIATMRLSDDWDGFKKNLDRALPKPPKIKS